MLSTLLNYRLYANDIAKSIQRVSDQATVEREAAYYKANIGKVETVDDLLKDYKLYSYAMKAYGLQDQIASKGLMKKVLQSDLTDANSFANKLTDQRYRQFAASFNFSSTGTKAIQTPAQTGLLTEAYSEHRVRAAAKVSATVTQYGNAVQSITNVDDLLADPVLFAVVAKVANQDPATADKAVLRDALLNGSSSSNTGLAGLRSMFNFQADGTLQAGNPVQTASQIADISATYFDRMGAGASTQAAALKVSYFNDRIAGITQASQITDDEQLFGYVLTAFGLDPTTESPSFVLNILNSQSGDASSALASMPTSTSGEITRKNKLVALNAAFNFTGTGAVPAGETALDSATTTASLEQKFYANYQTSANSDDARRTSVMEARLSNMKTINDLLGRDSAFGKAAFDYILTAFDIDPTTESSAKIRKVLLSDPSDPNSYVSKLKDERYEKLAAAFNFDAAGKVTTQRLAQSVSSQTTTGSLYAATFGKDVSTAQKSLITAATKDYLTAIGEVRSLDDFLSNDKLVKYALTAYGLEKEKISASDLKKLMTSDLSDPKSFANTKGDKRYVDFVSAFNFTPKGLIAREADGVQGGAKLLTTQNQYVLQTMEEQVGENSEGARLALYFLRKAPSITTAYGVLADKAVFETVRTALGLPASMANMSIESQAKLLESKIDFGDWQDTKKLDKFITRFSALYDIANGSSSSSSSVLSLFGNSSSGSTAGSLLSYL
ncbi:DUF1217 domain-containing protein [Aureimonas sp. ME7]|uniref:DUF1217 domain-containing protein n=1 Tax=Aureimonas sp. ME7 TaxID=2744252 RepID=UPI0015F41905|nr:DUF1217 domain-containing protein [Aureimonas sp. ME7]